MRAQLTLFLLTALLASCAARVRVGNAEPVAPPATLAVTNTLGLPVNVYMRVGQSEELLGQVGSNATRVLPVRVQPGTIITLRATRADGSTSYTRPEFVLAKESTWKVPP